MSDLDDSQQRCRVDSKARLTIFNWIAGGPGNPKIGDTIRDIAPERRAALISTACSDDYMIWIAGSFSGHSWNVFWRMLAIAIQRHHAASASIQCLLKATP